MEGASYGRYGGGAMYATKAFNGSGVGE